MTTDETLKLIRMMLAPALLHMEVQFKAIRDILEHSGACTPKEFEARTKEIYIQFGPQLVKRIQDDLTIIKGVQEGESN